MARFMLVPVVLFLLASGPAVRGQDTNETKRLKERVELLETKLKLAEKENELLKKELEAFKKGKADDGFGVGTKLVGTLTRSALVNGKPWVEGSDVEFEVTKRSGKEFTAQVWGHNRKDGFEVEGTIDNTFVKFRSTKALTDGGANVVGLHVFTGRLVKGILTGHTTKKGDATYRGEWKASPVKE